MSSWTDAFGTAWHLLVTGDPGTYRIIWVTVQVAAVSTAAAAVIGLPVAVTLGIGRFRGRETGLVLANAGLGLPPVIVGLFFVLLTLPATGPLAGLQLLNTLNGVFVVQTVLALPVVIALSASAIRSVSPGLLEQARAFGANRRQLAALAIREARVGIVAALTAAVGSALSEVGAVILAGGNIQGVNQTLASAALFEIDSSHYVLGLALGIILLGLVVLVSAALTWLQFRGGRLRDGDVRSWGRR